MQCLGQFLVMLKELTEIRRKELSTNDATLSTFPCLPFSLRALQDFFWETVMENEMKLWYLLSCFEFITHCLRNYVLFSIVAKNLNDINMLL